MSMSRQGRRSRWAAAIAGLGLAATTTVACSSPPAAAPSTTTGTSSAPTTGSSPSPTSPSSTGTTPATGGGTPIATTTAPRVDLAAAKVFAGESCSSEVAVVAPPTARLVRTTNLTSTAYGTISGVTGTPRLADLAGLTGQAWRAGRGLLTVDADGTLRGQWAGLAITPGTLAETGSVVENTVLGTGYGDAKAVGGTLRLQGMPSPTIVVLRGDGRLELSVVGGPAKLSLGTPRVIARGLTRATAANSFATDLAAGGSHTVLVLVADPGGLTQYIVDLDHPATAPKTRRVTTAVPSGIVSLGVGSCLTNAGNQGRPSGHGIVVAYDQAARGHVLFGNWDQITGEGTLAYVGDLTVPTKGGVLAP